ncbi:MAG TPA: serine/threonine-protein kinase, partial [Holophagaceae bacterium]|nr:serine/threonine-protein kinase [Holophagaceae bacterium]
EICAQICDGLASAHERGIFHRDVKPSNVRVRRESGRLLVKLMDFGVARMPGSKLTATGDVVGTYAYMAPEYLRGGEAGVQSDLYPVGMMLCEALTGELPQMGPTLPHGAAGRKRQAAKPPPTAVSPVIWNLLDKALSPDPTHRFASALEFSRALRAAIPLVGAAPAPEARPADAPPPAAAAAPKPLTIVRTAEPEPAKVWPWLVGAAVVAGGLAVWQLREKQAPSIQGPATGAAQPASPAQGPAQNQPRQVVPAAAPPQMQAPTQGQNQAPNPGQAGAPRPQDPPPAAPPPKPESADSINRGPSSQDLAFVHAQAEAFAAAYNRERWSDMGTVLDELAARRIDGGTFGQESAVREVMQSNRASRRIPRDLMDRIRTYLPPPPGGEQGGPPQQQRPH